MKVKITLLVPFIKNNNLFFFWQVLEDSSGGTSKRKRNKNQKGFSTGQPKVDIKMLNEENSNSNTQTSAFSDENSNEKTKSDDHDDALPKLFSEESDSDENVKLKCEKSDKTVNDNNNPLLNFENVAVKQNSVENGLKLARRNFSDGIFENCSTYNLSSPDVPHAKRHEATSDAFSSFDNRISVDEKDTNPVKNTSHAAGTKRSVSADTDQIPLNDSFFANVNRDDVSFTRGDDNFNGNKTSPGIQENNVYSFEDNIAENNEKQLQKSERRLSKKWRKKQKKDKSKNTPTYDCSKCGVSYVLSTNASHSTARCLHCDLCKSVEPVFTKRGKQPWNTCRIC